MKVLNVAEKNNAAKNIAALLSGGNSRMREGFSKYNKIYQFSYNAFGRQCDMMMTSVSGHLFSHDFPPNFNKWSDETTAQLFTAPVMIFVTPDMKPIEQTLQREARYADKLIIWTDGDREGENIGFEIINVCRKVKPHLDIWRARFSEITFHAVSNALRNLQRPNERISQAVDCRIELDLRTGCAFTRLMCLHLKPHCQGFLGEKELISYGSCQFPTLGFVVERYKAFKQFIRESFWKIRVIHHFEPGCQKGSKKLEDLTQPEKRRKVESPKNQVDFNWKRIRLFDRTFCEIILDICKEQPEASVIGLSEKPKSKWRPLPMDTVELEKLSSRLLKISAKETMRIAEKLYSDGFISYPRTETNKFPKNLDLNPFIQAQTGDVSWGTFAADLLTVGANPRKGKKSDEAHPPIHPIKAAPNLQGNEKRVYELIVRHFLATCSDDARGTETTLTINIAGEIFTAEGLVIKEYNYLEVYIYDKWNCKSLPHYPVGYKFIPTRIEMVQGETSPPQLLSEADLIALMDKHGIGTDATHAEHIENIQLRKYVGMTADRRFCPGRVGMGLVEGYDAIRGGMSKPHLRSQLEASLKDIAEGRRQKEDVVRDEIQKYRNIYMQVYNQLNLIENALKKYTQPAQT